MTHILGFNSQINKNGISNINGSNASTATWHFFSRYDLNLKTPAGYPLTNAQQLVIPNTTCTNYGTVFNTASAMNSKVCGSCTELQILSPDFSNPDPQNTTCSTAMMYVSSTVSQPVFTPNQFVDGSSLSHFEDQCQVPSGFSPSPPNSKDKYFLMGKSGGSIQGEMRRYLKPEERLVLCDIGYNVNATYGSSAVYGSYVNYGIGSTCPGLSVVGVSDGGVDGFYQYTTNLGEAITITNALQNDLNATKMECLEVVLGNPSGLSNVTNTSFTYTPSSTVGPEINVIRYLPANNSGVQGNITYIFIVVMNANCTNCLASSNAIVSNGNFETSGGPVTPPCGPLYHTKYPTGHYLNCWVDYTGNPDLTPVQVPVLNCGGGGALSTNKYVNFNAATSAGTPVLMQNILREPLKAGGSYKLEFYARYAGGSSNSYSNELAIFGTQELLIPQYDNPTYLGIPVSTAKFIALGNGTSGNLGIIEMYGAGQALTTSWSKFTYNFTIPSGLQPAQYSYITIGAWSGDFDLDEIVITSTGGTASFATASSLLSYYGTSGTGVVTTNNVINIASGFTVDVNLNLKACPHVICEQDAIVTVPNSKTLSITDGTIVRGQCDGTWKGIKTAVSAPATIFIDKSEIHDMTEGVLIAGSTSLSCTDSRFIDNVIGIDFLRTPVGYTDIVTGNEFYKEITNRGDVGIVIHECSNVQVGNLSNGMGNAFHDLKTGICIEHLKANSAGYGANPHTFELYNNDFRNIFGGRLTSTAPYVNIGTTSDKEGSAIYALYDYKNMMYRFTSLSAGTIIVDRTPGNNSIITACDKGIYIDGQFGAQIQNQDMMVGWGIMATHTDGQNYTVQNNSITNAIVGMSFNGINDNSIVSDNFITTTWLASAPHTFGGFQDCKGIEVTSYLSAAVANTTRPIPFLIQDNEIQSFSESGAGINLQGASGAVSVLGNDISLWQMVPSSAHFSSLSGISSALGHTQMISENIITHASRLQTTVSAVNGIHLSSTTNNLISCNNLSQLQYGFNVEGNCKTSFNKVIKNTFNNHNYAICFRHLGTDGTLGDIGLPAVLGSAGYNCGNQFIGTYFGGVKLYSFCPATSVSLYKICAPTTISTASSSGCAYAYQYTGTGAPQSCSIVVGSPGNSTTMAPPVTGMEDLNYEHAVATNQVLFGEYQDGTVWLEQSRLFHLLRTIPSLMSSDTILSNFYAAMQGTAMEEIDALNDLIMAADTARDSAVFAAAWINAWQANASLQISSDQCANEQHINEIFLKYMLGGRDTLSSTDSGTIAAIAFQCPNMGGNAVYKARNLYQYYKPLMYYSNLGLCNYPNPSDSSNGLFDEEQDFLASIDSAGGVNYFRPAGDSGSQPGLSQHSSGNSPAKRIRSSATPFRLYPNPVNGTLNIIFGTEGALEISDITGRHIKTIVLSQPGGGRLSISTQDLPAGICICRYYADGKLQEVSKITVLHD